jgi:hypothetical protein
VNPNDFVIFYQRHRPTKPKLQFNSPIKWHNKLKCFEL